MGKPTDRFTSLVFGIAALGAASGLTAAPAAKAQGLTTPAEYAFMMDADSDLVLYNKNGDELMAPASMSKLMTVLMAFEALQNSEITLEDEVEISENAWRKGGAASGSSTMFAEVGSKIPVGDLLRGIIIQSGNDASIAIAEYLGGTEEEFARMMTQKAREIGLEHSTFANATGWPNPDHRMTARELALLADYMIETYPDLYALYAETQFTWNGITQGNRNPLLGSLRGADGLKTGHTEDSGYGLVASAQQDGQRLILVVNGLESERARATEPRRLLQLGFNAFKRYDLFEAGEEVSVLPVWMGAEDAVKAVVNEDVRVMLRKTRRDELKVRTRYITPVQAPIAAGQRIGTVTVEIPDQAPRELALYAANDVPKAGIAKRMRMALGHLLFGGTSAQAASGDQ